jgi:outer membrane protein assembly factor BamB
MTDRPGSSVLGRLLVLVLVALAGPLSGQGLEPGDWPEWRGPDGLGVSSETGLPLALDAGSTDLLWKVEVKGEGISSPIVVGNRVFLTTAYPGTEQSRAQDLKRYGIPLLAAIAALLGLARLRRGLDPATGAPGRLDAGLTALATTGFLVGALLATFWPTVFPAWKPGVQGWAWFYTAAFAMVGLAAAAGWFPMRSSVRLLAVALLAAFALHAWRDIGLNSYGQTFKTKYRLVMVAPAALGALWHALAFLVGRRRPAARAGGPGALAGALAQVALAGVLFVTVNYLLPKTGRMRAVLCHDLDTGALQWDAPLFVAPEEQKFATNSFATPTAVSDGETLFAYFGSGWAGLDLDGNVLYVGHDPDYAPNTRYGTGASPIAYRDTFIVLQEKEYNRPSFIAAFDKRTGEERWRVNPFYASDSYCTPLLVPRGDGFELVTASAERAVAHSPDDGELLWQISLPIRQMVPSLCRRGDMVFVAGGTHTKTSTSGVRLSGTGKATQPELAWQSKRGSPECASPVIANDLYFTVADGGLMSCYDPETGEKHWFERLDTGEYWSSLVAAEGRVYAISDEGKTFTVAARPDFEVLAQGQLGEPTLATPAIAHGRILVRTFTHLYCFGDPARAER